MKKTYLLFVFVMITGTIKAQLFEQKTFYPNTASVIRESLNGSGGAGFWTEQRLDSLGRTVVKDYYRNKKHLQQDRYDYNNKNDLISEVVVFDIHEKNKNDSTRYEYVYEKDLIVYQKRTAANGDSTVIKLEKHRGDSILNYIRKDYTYVRDKKVWVQTITGYVLTIRDKRIIRVESEGINHTLGKVSTAYKYDKDGKMIRRFVKGNTPEAFIMGSPGGPTREYEYSYDRFGRLAKMHTVTNGKTVLLARYTYH